MVGVNVNSATPNFAKDPEYAVNFKRRYALWHDFHVDDLVFNDFELIISCLLPEA